MKNLKSIIARMLVINMALIIAALVFLKGVEAFAMVQLPGTFVANECGRVAVDRELGLQSGVISMCFGELTGAERLPEATAVKLVLADEGSKVFKVIQINDLGYVGFTGLSRSVVLLQSEDGELTSLKVVRGRDGHVFAAEGVFAGQKFLVKGFAPVVQIL